MHVNACTPVCVCFWFVSLMLGCCCCVFFVGFVVVVFWMVGEFFPVPCSVPGSFNLSCTSLSYKHHQRNEREKKIK